jgi:hypothetical protein
MDIITSLAIVTMAALVHASFQLSVSVLTLLSGHAIGAKKSHRRTVALTGSFVIGAGIMTLLLLAFFAATFSHVFGNGVSAFVWALACGLLIGVGLAVWVFYYRRERGTTIWVPRSFARHLSNRSKATKDPTEAFSLGLTSVISEILFIVAPLAISALVIVQLPGIWQLVGVAIYTVISLLALLIVWISVSSGHSISAIQKWRESNKHFLQFAAGSALVILGAFVYVNQIVSMAVGMA